MKKVTFIGLGAMGFPMAGHLTKLSDYQVTVYNRTWNKAQAWQNQYATPDNLATAAVNLAQAVKGADVIILCLGRDEDVLSIVEQNAFLDNLEPNATVIDHTTTSYQLAIKLKTLLERHHVKFIDGPVSGGAEGALNGVLSVMAGGNSYDLKAIQPILNCYAKTVTLIGQTGHGQLAKMVNQICIAGVLQGLSEGLKFAEMQELNIEHLLKAISGGAAQSWEMDNRAKTMHQRQFDFGFAINWMSKDLGYCLDQAKNSHAPLPLTKQVYDQYQQLIAEGHGDADSSVLIRSLDKMK